MKILLIDPTASFLDFALRCEADGHEIRWFLGPDKLAGGGRFTVGDGLDTGNIHKITDFRSSLKWADIILNSDNCKYVHELDSYRRSLPFFSPNLECTQWELDRMCGQRVLEEAGIPVQPVVEFTNYDEAIAYQLANMDKRFVSKPCADVSKALSYVSKGPADMLFMLEYWKRSQKKKVPFIFQEFFPGIEMAVGGWVGKNGFSQYFLENFEFKKLMNEEIGVNTGEQGTVMQYVTEEESKLAREALIPLEPYLIRCGYTGYIDVAVMINKKGDIMPLEFTCRPGWPLFQIQQSLHPDPVEWMRDLIDGVDTFKPYNGVATGIVVAMPDYPYSHLTRKEVTGFPVWGITEKNRFNIHPCEMMLGSGYDDKGKKQPMLVSAGDYVLVVSGVAANAKSSRERAYKTLKELEIPNSPMYRTDIGCRLEEQLPKLQQHGFAEAWTW